MDNQDYLTDYRLFFDNFYQSFEMDNPLPVHIGKYNVAEFEIAGEVICWCLEYLNNRKCPPSLIAPLCRSVIVELEEVIGKDPESCGYRPKEDDYQTLKLMQVTIKKLHEVCLRYRDNSEVSRLPPPPPVSPSVSAAAVKNSRRTMEDCHIVINDLHALFGIEGYGVASYYAVFDGHIGSDAALYSCSHIYQYLVESQYYPANPEAAFKEAFIKTDERFIVKSNKENLKSGTTAVCILIRHDLGKMYVAWLGDSQAILVNGREFTQLVKPHRPDQVEERERIEAMGGSVLFWGTWRVNGQLAVSRAIGDVDYKPYVSAEPDVTVYELTGDEDFLLLACDGLWDVVLEEQAVKEVYKCLEDNKGDRSRVSQSLVQLAKSLGSKDNISVVVAWLDMSTLENGHFVPESEVDSVDDLLLPPVLRSLKPAAQTIAPPVPQRLDENAEQWLKTLPWSYADALRKPAPKKEEPLPPPIPAREPTPIQPPAKEVESMEQPKEETKASKDDDVAKAVPSKEPDDAVPKEDEKPSPKGDDSGDVGGEGDSGDDSDEEWNYISGKENREPNQHTKQELTREEMESQLNPNAAEFVPVYGSRSPTSEIDIVDISHSPTKQSEIRTLENVVIPTANEFFTEITKRPSEIEDFSENETTLNGGDLTNLSTKAVFGDDSVCMISANDSSLVQNEALKNTNPFAPSQVPNFVQDHFSAPDAFKSFTDSKNNVEFDFMGGSEKPDLLSPNKSVQEVYASGQTCLTGLTFGDVMSVDDIVRSKQDSPLLRESPEPGLHNGQLEHEAKTPDVVQDHSQECDKEQLGTSEIIKEVSSQSPAPTDSQQEEVDTKISELTADALIHSDHGPETSVDSESEDDVLVSPKSKEKHFEEVKASETESVQDPVCTLKPSHDMHVTEKLSDFGTELEEDHVFHKDDEDGEEVLICPVKKDNAPILPKETQAENLSEVTSDAGNVFDGIPSDFEIVHQNGEHTDQEFLSQNEKENEFTNIQSGNKDNVDLFSRPEVVEEVISKEEVHEDLICPMKETPLLKDALKETFDTKKDLEDETNEDQAPHDFIPEPQDSDEKYLENEFKLEKEIEEPICILKKEEDQVQDKEESTQAIEEPLCSLKKDEETIHSVMRNEFSEEEVVFVDKGDKQSQLDSDLVCPVKVEEDLICPRKMEEELVCSVKADEDVCPVKVDQFLVDSSIKTEEDMVCPVKIEQDVCPAKVEEDVKCPTKVEEDVKCATKVEEDLICPTKVEEDDICPSKVEENSVCSAKIEDLTCPTKIEDDFIDSAKDEGDFVCSFKSSEKQDLVSSIEKVEEKDKDEDIICTLKEDHLLQKGIEASNSDPIDDTCNKRNEELTHALEKPNDFISTQPEEEIVAIHSVETLTEKTKDNFDIQPFGNFESHEKLTHEITVNNVEQTGNIESNQDVGIENEIFSGKDKNYHILSEDNLISPEKIVESSLDNIQTFSEDKLHHEESTDEMSSSMIDHGEEKSLPEPQSNQLDLVQDLQFEVQEKGEADTESDSGFEIINASEASTIEMEMRIQSEKEAGAVDEKLHLDKNEAEVTEKVEVTDPVQMKETSELLEKKPLEPEPLVRTELTPATPPATPAPGLEVESKEGLIAAAVAAAGVATAVAAGSAAVAVAEAKVEEKKKPASPKKAEPAAKTAPAKSPITKASPKPAASTKAPATAAKSLPGSTAKAATKPSSPATKTAPTAPKPSSASSKPSTPTSKVAAKTTLTKPSGAPSATKPTTSSSAAPKSKPATSSTTKSATPTASAKPPATKPTSTIGAAKKPAPTSAAKPTSTTSKPAVSSTVGARPATKAAAPASSATKPPVTTTQKSPTTKTAPTKPPTPTGTKANSVSARPPSAKGAPPTSKTPSSTAAPAKTAPKPPPIRAPASKTSTTTTAAKTTPATTTAAKAAPATKPPAAKPTAPAKTNAAPINKKPAAPTAIKKSTLPTDKSVKEANNKLASTKTAVKIEDKKIVSKKTDVAENDIPLTQEPVVTTTNGHISLIENGISSPEIVAEVN